MRKVSFTWKGEPRELVPTMAVLASMASDLARMSEGLENSVTLASKMLGGGADPVFASVALWHMMRAAQGDKFTMSKEDAYEQMLSADIPLSEKAEFRQAYISAVLPSVDMGKKPVAPEGSAQ